MGIFSATRLGSGVYFARDASYSCQLWDGKPAFTPADNDGFRYMYYAKVLVGDYIEGRKDMKDRPCKVSTGDTYDSVVDNVANPTIYVVFKDYEYLIKFKYKNIRWQDVWGVTRFIHNGFFRRSHFLKILNILSQPLEYNSLMGLLK